MIQLDYTPDSPELGLMVKAQQIRDLLTECFTVLFYLDLEEEIFSHPELEGGFGSACG